MINWKRNLISQIVDEISLEDLFDEIFNQSFKGSSYFPEERLVRDLERLRREYARLCKKIVSRLRPSEDLIIQKDSLKAEILSLQKYLSDFGE